MVICSFPHARIDHGSREATRDTLGLGGGSDRANGGRTAGFAPPLSAS
jgi:hypothetical protein